MDQLPKDAIHGFVLADSIEFTPMRIITQGDNCNHIVVAIPFDRVIGIYYRRSEILATSRLGSDASGHFRKAYAQGIRIPGIRTIGATQN